ncbi:hypothetical protein GR702_01330 [Novosphingobium sp. FGD1]|uniref:HTH cro/C1-type domain-containing protein n=1 Tax=Novosphingobium silvae TaxID=2692619 RepID=A0A7X4GD64_9SPHN|nr:hypothetical protein [Novosphingobium silvae]MYL96416.1 hypothetical protein [Novosphingobium silvae]
MNTHVRENETLGKSFLGLTSYQISARHAQMTKSVPERLKELRISAVPRLSIRKMAEELGVTFPRYVYFEDSKRFKKRELPLEFTRQIADVLSRYGVDPMEVMKLAGLSEAEAEPEVREIEAAQPKRHWINLPVCLPSEAALAAMFETLLALIPEDATRAEAARILAQRLPTGFAAIGPDVYEEGSDEEPVPALPPRGHAKGRRDSPRL